jgi:hypothetical protein
MPPETTDEEYGRESGGPVAVVGYGFRGFLGFVWVGCRRAGFCVVGG